MGDVISGNFRSGLGKKNIKELYEAIATTLNQEASPFMLKWPHLYRVLAPEKGRRIIVEEKEGQVLEEVPAEAVIFDVVKWIRLHQVPEWFLTVKNAKEAVDMWTAMASPLKSAEIANVRWADEDGYTWHRLPWKRTSMDDLPGDKSPTWESMLARMVNAQAFIDWVGSLLVEDSSIQDYCWIHGTGHDGKGAINRFLAKVFGKSYRTKQPPRHDDRFWTNGLVGARLVVFPDCNSYSFTTSGIFKSLTGGDHVTIEAKYKDSYTTKLNCKFLIFSNNRPAISSERADMRRLVYCEFTKPGDYDPTFEERLWGEGGHFLSHCVGQYLEKYPERGAIEKDNASLQEWVSVVEEDYEAFFENHFKRPAQKYRQRHGLHGMTFEQVAEVAVTPERMQGLMRVCFKNRREQLEFKAWLERKFGVTKEGVKLADGDVRRFYVGICLRHQLLATSTDHVDK
jgi:hypothetical protein